MTKRRKRARKASRQEDDGSLGSALDEVGWKPESERIRLKPRIEKTIEQVRLEYEKALSALAAERRFGGPHVASTELEMLEEATELVRRVLSESK